MRVMMVDIDSTIPNLALAHASAWHKARGDTVGFNVSNPDRIYISCIFKANAHKAYSQKYMLERMYPNAEILMGGSGISLETTLPEPEMDAIKPDYDLYNGMMCERCDRQIHACKCGQERRVVGNQTFSQGFTTRGCIRKCKFCIVPKKEGDYHRHMHIREFWDERHKKVLLQDNNVYADKDWFFENTDFLLEKDLKVDVNQGMDIRILDQEIADRIGELKFYRSKFFAFDSMAYEPFIVPGIEMLKEAGVDVRNRVFFFVLVGFNTTPEEDVYRCQLLKKHDANTYVMKYKDTPWTRKIARWANNSAVYRSCDFEEFEKKEGVASLDEYL